MTELLLQHRGKLSVHLLVSSGVAILEADPITRKLLLSDGASLDIFADKLCNLKKYEWIPPYKMICITILTRNMIDSGSMDHQEFIGKFLSASIILFYFTESRSKFF